jgi:DNA-binding protein H-NS
MSEFAKKLLSKNSLRKGCSELDGETISKVIVDLNEILIAKQEAEAAELAEQQAKQDKIEAIKAQMEELDMKPYQLFNMIAEMEKKKPASKAKYRLIDEAGKVHEWSGRGRTPLVFQQRIDAGASKDDFLIKD